MTQLWGWQGMHGYNRLGVFLRNGLLTGLLLCAFSKPAVAEDHPSKTALQAFLKTIRSMHFPVKDQAHHENVVKQAHSFLNLESMVRAALMSHWEQASAENREAFLDLMWRLVEHIAYERSHRFLGNLEVTYPEMSILDRGVEVKSRVTREERALDAEIIYRLEEQAAGWVIYDVILDGVSMIEDLHYQFDKIIRDTSFQGLLDRMRDRLVKAEKTESETR